MGEPVSGGNGEIRLGVCFAAPLQERDVGGLLLKRNGQLPGFVRITDVSAVALDALFQRHGGFITRQRKEAVAEHPKLPVIIGDVNFCRVISR